MTKVIPPRIVLHAGFQKTGSTTVQAFIRQNHGELFRAQKIHLGEDLDRPKDWKFNGHPLWTIHRATIDEHLAQDFNSRIIKFGKSITSNEVGLVASEMMSHIAAPALFRGIDDVCEVQIVFYIRPQFDWIPSAWKQWGLKRGVDLKTYAQNALNARYPDYRKVLDTWSELLPNSKISVIPLSSNYLRGGDLQKDFCASIGMEPARLVFLGDRGNPSLDYSMLHLLSRHAPKFFESVSDNDIVNAMVRKMPSEYRSTNIGMLPNEMMELIAKQYEADNRYILKTYSQFEDRDEIYAKVFRPKVQTRNYVETSDREKLLRAVSVLADVLGNDKCLSHLADLVHSEFGL